MRSRGYLPHWERESATYFVTMRTIGSVSLEEIRKLKLSRYTPDEKRIAIVRAVELLLDHRPESGPLRGAVARIVAEAILHRDRTEYELGAWCVMPNHVHLVFQIAKGRQLPSVIQSLKSFTAHEVNRMAGTRGSLWEREYFDRIVRSEGLGDCVRYVLNNPTKAGLQNWPWVGTGQG
jgi:type I restriction enzyme R subunit/putative DNA methylase